MIDLTFNKQKFWERYTRGKSLLATAKITAIGVNRRLTRKPSYAVLKRLEEMRDRRQGIKDVEEAFGKSIDQIVEEAKAT